MKGKPKRANAGVHQVVNTRWEKHSKKPEEAKKRRVQLMGDVPRIELFAREKTEGWDSIGDGIDGLDISKSLENIIGK